MSKQTRISAIKSKIEYMNNCMFWLQNYVDNDISDYRVLDTLRNLEKHINTIRDAFKPIKPN